MNHEEGADLRAQIAHLAALGPEPGGAAWRAEREGNWTQTEPEDDPTTYVLTYDARAWFERDEIVLDELHRVRPEAARDLMDELIRRDREEWPRGHPCRDCGRFYDAHRADVGPDVCEGWR